MKKKFSTPGADASGSAGGRSGMSSSRTVKTPKLGVFIVV